MKAYWGSGPGKWWFAMTELPRVIQWAETPEEAKAKLCRYLEAHHRMTVVGWREFPGPCDDEKGET
jgi:predicted RNase H-like HicB family nuclease